MEEQILDVGVEEVSKIGRTYTINSRPLTLWNLSEATFDDDTVINNNN